ncbi:DEKNAAC104965 [Brettanomyces naardenensis]|uniref:non-specific serine/threonine protein kinase n=1 Tax=Brettanomyces naardenensis TaxID=13370 RepID=A0A448YSB4_BRENA|nr:DEKNAAC104965 [Brettanomyces naardenensis]
MAFRDQFQDLGIIGRGSFGCIRKVRRKTDGRVYVRKEISYMAMNYNEIRQLASEFRILRELNHPNIVEYLNHEDVEDQQMLYIYMEYCDGGDLSKLIRRYKEKEEYVPENLIWQIFTQVLLALYRCHNGTDIENAESIFTSTPQIEPPAVTDLHVVIHRDIKPDNVFLLSDGYTVKLGDFGLAKCLQSATDFAKTFVGTPYYMPPEVVMDRPYDPVCDIWSLGCVMYELCALRPPFQAKTHLKLQEKIKAGVFSPIPEHYSHRLKMCISACLITDPRERATVNQLLQDSSFKIYRKEWELVQQELRIKEREKDMALLEKGLKKYERELDEQVREMNIENEEIRNRYKREFNYVLDIQLNKILSELPPALRQQLQTKTKENQVPQQRYGPPPTLSSSKLKGPRDLQDYTNRLVRQPSRR